MSLNLFQSLPSLSLSRSWWPFLFSLSPCLHCALHVFFACLSPCFHPLYLLPFHLSVSLLKVPTLYLNMHLPPRTCCESLLHLPFLCPSSLARLPRSRPVSGAAPCARLRGLTPGQVGVCRARGEVMESVRKAAEMVIEEVWSITSEWFK